MEGDANRVSKVSGRSGTCSKGFIVGFDIEGGRESTLDECADVASVDVMRLCHLSAL